MRYFHARSVIACLCCAVFLCFGTFSDRVAALEIVALSDTALDPTDSNDGQTDVDMAETDSDTSGDNDISLMVLTGDDAFVGLAFLDVSSDLGDLRLYLPYGIGQSAVQVADGRIYNLSSSTLYLYSPDYPGYTFYANRFSPIQYRASNTGSYSELTGVQLLELGADSAEVMEYIILFLVLVIVFCMIRRCFL